MSLRWISLVATLGPLALSGTAGPEPPAEPVLTGGFVGRPQYQTTAGLFSAGTAFTIEVEDEPSVLMLTAQHVFGPPGGLKKEIKKSAMRDFVQEGALECFIRKLPMFARLEALPGSGAGVDVAVFRTNLRDAAAPRRIAAKNPRRGETLWLAAELPGQPAERHLFRCTVTQVGGDQMQCRFDDGNLSLRGSSGAPYLNAAGEVAGMALGGMERPGSVVGTAIPAEPLGRAVLRALGRTLTPGKPSGTRRPPPSPDSAS